MSLLSAANKQAKRLSQTHFFQPELLYGEGQKQNWLAWLISLPLCIVLGAGANYTWHLVHLQPRIKEISVPQQTELDYRWVPEDYSLVTEPLPESAPETASNADANPAPMSNNKLAAAVAAANQDQGGDSSSDTSPSPMPQLSLQQRVLQAARDTGNLGDTSNSVQPANMPSASGNVVAVDDLPVQIARQIPPLRYGAHVYSSQPAKRVININDHNYHEGEMVAPGIRLLEIQPRQSVFQMGAQRFSVKALTDWAGE